MAQQHEEFLAVGARVVTVVHDSLEHAQTYLERHPVPFPCLTDPEGTVYDLYQVESKVISLGQRPGMFIIDREGIVRFAYIGWQQWEIPANEKVLEVCRGLGCGS